MDAFRSAWLWKMVGGLAFVAVVFLMLAWGGGTDATQLPTTGARSGPPDCEHIGPSGGRGNRPSLQGSLCRSDRRTYTTSSQCEFW